MGHWLAACRYAPRGVGVVDVVLEALPAAQQLGLLLNTTLLITPPGATTCLPACPHACMHAHSAAPTR